MIKFSRSRTIGVALISAPAWLAPLAAQAEDAAAGALLQLEEVVVTAQKREENLQKSALSITALSGDDLAKQGGEQNLNQVLKSVPGLNSTSGGVNGSFFFIRGIGNAPTFGQDASVTLTVNGVFNQRGNSDRGSLYDMNRIEVARGPQSTLTGRSSEGGAIAVVSNEPKLGVSEVKAKLEAGNYKLLAGEGVLNMPLGENWALRTAFSGAKRDGYATNGSSDDDTMAGRVRLLYQASDDLKVIFSVDASNTGGQGAGGATSGYIDLSQPFQAVNGYWSNTSPSDNSNVYSVGDAYINFDWNTPWAEVHFQPTYHRNTLTFSQYALNEANYYNAQGLAGGYSATTAYLRNTSLQRLHAEVNQESADLHFNNRAESSIKWVAGAYYYRNEQAQNLRTASGTSTGTPNASATGIPPSVGYPTIWPESNHRTETNEDVFGQLTYPVSDTWRATAGARYSRVTKSRPFAPAFFVEPDGSVVNQGNSFPLNNNIAGTTTVGASNPITGLGSNSVKFDVPAASVTYTATNWKVVLEHDFTPTSLGYAMVSTGWKSGSFISVPNPDTLCTVGCTTLNVPYLAAGFSNSYDPEHLRAYEIGSKNTFLDSRLRLNGSLFFYDYKGYQFAYSVNIWNPATGVDPDFTGTNYTANAKKAESYGGEIESSFLLTTRDRLDLNVSYLHAVFKTIEVSSNAATAIKAWAAAMTDQPLPFAPEWGITPTYSHSFALPGGASLTAAINGQYEAKKVLRTPSSTLQLAHPEYYYQPSYWKENASLVFTSADGKRSVTGYVKNISDKTTFNQWTTPTAFTTFGSVSFSPDDPRTFGIIFSVAL